MQTDDSTINSEQPQEQEQQPTSIAEAMRQTMDDIKKREAKEEKKAQQPKEAKKEKESPKSEPNETKQAKEEPKAEEAEKTEGKPEETKKSASEKAETKPNEEKKTIRAPSSWSAKAKDTFYELPDHIKQEVLKREEDFHSGIKQYKEKSDYAEKIQKIIQPYEPALRASGQNTEQVIQTLLDASYRLSQGTPQQKAQYLLQVAQESGADLQSLINSGDNNQNTGDNYSAEQSKYIQQLEQRLNYLEGHTKQQATLSMQKQEQQITSQIEQFKNAVDDAGMPKHPYFENVESDMAALITIAKQQGRPAPTLSEAYEQAVWVNPQTREALLLKQQKESQARKEAEASRKAQEAARKTHTNVRTTPSVEFTPNAPMGDIRQTMRAALNDIKARS